MSPLTRQRIQTLQGPIAVFGAGGFIGVNLLQQLLSVREDVVGVATSPLSRWRLQETRIPHKHLRSCDVLDSVQLQRFFEDHAPRTLFQLCAYGAYSKQQEFRRIYRTNFNSVVELIELARQHDLAAFVQAGSNSEYGLNAAAPREDGELCPNSHYAVSKVAASYAVRYYGRVEGLPVVNLRLYSVYGPWEEPDRLIPQLLRRTRQGQLPPFTEAEISRDFIHVNDVCAAFVAAALAAPRLRGRSLNIATGVKTTMRQLAELACRIGQLQVQPQFATMPNRKWDVCDWYGNPSAAHESLDWKAEVSLCEGLRSTLAWQQQVGFDQASWNWTQST